MKPRIFKTLLFAIALAIGLQNMAHGQTMTAEQQKNMEQKLKEMEQKLQVMQSKLDSMKTHPKVVSVNGVEMATRDMDRAMSALSRVSVPMAKMRMPAMPAMPAMPKMPKMNFHFDSMDKNIEEKVKSGEVKLKTKSYSKSYPVDKDDKLVLDNQYGKVTVNTWAKNEVKVDAEIKAYANDDAETQKLLDQTTVADSKANSTVSYTTTIDKKDGSNNMWGSWSTNGKSYVHKVEINYTVYMPAKNALSLSNRYGGVTLPDLDGKLSINTTYGNFTAKNLTNADNEITLRYSDGNIASLNGGKLNCSFGNTLKIDAANNLNLEAKYISADIAKLKSSGNISMRYGDGIKIGDLDKNLKSLNINADYADVTLGLDSKENFDFDVTVSYSTFNYGNHDVTVTSKSPEDDARRWSSTKNYKGHLGKGDPAKTVTIKSRFNPVNFNLQ